MIVTDVVEVRDGDRSVRLSPGEGFHVQAAIDFDPPVCGAAELGNDAHTRCFSSTDWLGAHVWLLRAGGRSSTNGFDPGGI